MDISTTLFHILQLFEALACIVGFVFYKKLKPSYWRIFPFYLAFIVCAELTGHYFNVHDMVIANRMFFNYFEIPVEFIFFFWLFFQSFRSVKYKWLPMACIWTYLGSWVIDKIFLSNHPSQFSSFSYTVGNLLLLVLILSFFIMLVTSDAILTFRQNRLFWISLGLLIYYFVSFPFYGLNNTMAAASKDIILTYKYIVQLLDCMMYLMFIFSFIWGKSNIKPL
jgi:hypothetical protein